MDKFFAIFGKFILIVFFVGLLAGGGYWLGRNGNVQTTTPPAKTQPSPTATEIPLQTITAGLGADSGLSFTKYSLQVANSWTPDHVYTNEGTPIDTVTISKGTYQIKIFQAATGGAMCLYPGDAAFEGPSSTYDAFVELTTTDGVLLRRGGSKGGFTVCQKGSENFGQPTGFGHISYTTPAAPDPKILLEMDEMIKSLKKI